MTPYRPSALLASAALVLGAALVPASAFADGATAGPTPTSAITNADLLAALSAAQAPTAAAAAAGWTMQGTESEAGAAPTAVKAIYAVDRGLADAGTAGTMIEAQHAGTYLTIASGTSHRRIHRALKAIKKPHASWVFLPDRSLDLHSHDGSSLIGLMAPDIMLSVLSDPTQMTLTAPTGTSVSDGTATYTFTATSLADGQSGTGSLTINSSHILTAYTSVSAADSEAGSYAYGPQHVALPAKSRTVTEQQLSEGFVLSTLPKQVKVAAKLIARAATYRAHRHVVTAASIRSYATKAVKGIDRALGAKVFTAKATARGVRITGTNPFTHAHASYTVSAAGRKATVHRG